MWVQKEVLHQQLNSMLFKRFWFLKKNQKYWVQVTKSVMVNMDSEINQNTSKTMIISLSLSH